MQHDHQPMNLCFTCLSRSSCVWVEGHGMCAVLSSDFANNLFVAGRQDRWMPVFVYFIVYFIYPLFSVATPPGCQSLNILCVCRDARVIRMSLSCGWPQTATAETVEIHKLSVQYMLCVCGVGGGGGHIAFYVPSELYIEADHTTVVWLFV